MGLQSGPGVRPEEYPKPSSVRQGTARLRWWEDERWRSEVEVEFFSPSGEKLRTGNVSPPPPRQCSVPVPDRKNMPSRTLVQRVFDNNNSQSIERQLMAA